MFVLQPSWKVNTMMPVLVCSLPPIRLPTILESMGQKSEPKTSISTYERPKLSHRIYEEPQRVRWRERRRA